MRNTKKPFLFAFLLMCASSGPSFGQQRVFGWQPGNDESVRLDPANYHAGVTYHPARDGGNMQVDIKSQQPVTIFLTPTGAWNGALQHPEGLDNLQKLCQREHVVETRYSCFVPPEAMTLIIRDERSEERRVGKSVDLGGRRIIKKKKKLAALITRTVSRSST